MVKGRKSFLSIDFQNITQQISVFEKIIKNDL